MFTRLSALETLQRIVFVLNGLAELPGRKSILLFTEQIAMPSDSVVEYAPAIERAHQRLLDAATRASATIYSIDPRGLVAFQPEYLSPAQTALFGLRSLSFVYRESQAGMRYLAEATGGQFLHDINDLSIPVRMVMNDQQGYYLLGYTPDPSTFATKAGRPKFHKIAVRVSRRGLTVRSHAGFAGVEDRQETPAPPGAKSAMIAALLSPFAGGDIEVGISAVFLNTAGQGSLINTLVGVKASGLTVIEEENAWMAEGDILLMVFGENGALADERAIDINTKLSGTDYDRALNDGLLFSLPVPVKKAGPYEVRVAVRDKATGKIGTASQFVEVPELKPDRIALSGITLQTVPAVSEEQSSPSGADLRPDSALRIFRRGDAVTYGYQILNPRLLRGARQPKVEAQVRAYRDGKEVFTGKAVPVEVGADPTRLLAGGGLRLGPDMPPGDYVLQVVVTDLLADVLGADGHRNRTATQYIDFQIAP
jgi:hypothetical protein